MWLSAEPDRQAEGPNHYPATEVGVGGQESEFCWVSFRLLISSPCPWYSCTVSSNSPPVVQFSSWQAATKRFVLTEHVWLCLHQTRFLWMFLTPHRCAEWIRWTLTGEDGGYVSQTVVPGFAGRAAGCSDRSTLPPAASEDAFLCFLFSFLHGLSFPLPSCVSLTSSLTEGLLYDKKSYYCNLVHLMNMNAALTLSTCSENFSPLMFSE